MLNQIQLLALHESLRDCQVLSVYIDGSAPDPALHRTWRLSLTHALDATEVRLRASSPEEQTAFARCRDELEATLAQSAEAGQTRGWAGFFTTSGVAAALQLPVATPTWVAWSRGGAFGPYLRARRDLRDVVVAVADARHATLHRYHDGVLQQVERVRAHHPTERAAHMGAPAADGFHSGTRGRTAKEAAQRMLRYGRDRMLSEAAARIAKLVDPDGWIVLAGGNAVVSKLVARLNGLAPGRVARAEEIDAHSTEAQIAAAAAIHATALAATLDLHRLADVAEAAGAGGLGVMGRDATARALEQQCVRALYVTAKYAAQYPAECDDAIRIALDQSATVDEVDRDAAALLDERGGIAAALRFRPPTLRRDTEGASTESSHAAPDEEPANI